MCPVSRPDTGSGSGTRSGSDAGSGSDTGRLWLGTGTHPPAAASLGGGDARPAARPTAGTRPELLAAGGRYANLYSIQAAAYTTR